jgi:hypothetical protein
VNKSFDVSNYLMFGNHLTSDFRATIVNWPFKMALVKLLWKKTGLKFWPLLPSSLNLKGGWGAWHYSYVSSNTTKTVWNSSSHQTFKTRRSFQCTFHCSCNSLVLPPHLRDPLFVFIFMWVKGIIN